MAELKAMMVFKRADGRNTTITVPHADAAIDGPLINGAMDTILTQNIFAPEQMDLVSKVEGKLVTTDIQEFTML